MRERVQHLARRPDGVRVVLLLATLAAREDHARARGLVNVRLLLLFGGRSFILRSKPLRAGCRSVVETPNTHGDAHLEEGGGGAELSGRTGGVKDTCGGSGPVGNCKKVSSLVSSTGGRVTSGQKKTRGSVTLSYTPIETNFGRDCHRLSATFAVYSKLLVFL